MEPVRTITFAGLQTDAVKVSTPAEADAAAERVAALLKRPLGPGAAVQVALLNNRGLQATYNELGISEAEYVQASLPPSPRLGFNQLAGDFEVEITRQLVGNLLALITLPARAEIAQDRFRAAQLRAAGATLAFAVETRKQYYRAVAANEQLNLIAHGHGNAAAGSDGIELTRAGMQLRTERERLTRQMGLWDDRDYTLPARLPPTPARIRSIREVEAQSLRQRLDLQVARSELESLAKTLGLTEATRFISDLDLVAQNRYKSTDKYTADSVSKTKTITNGFAATIEIPLFDFGQARVAEAEQRYLQAANRLAEMAVNARSEAREAYDAYRGSYELARAYRNRIGRLERPVGLQDPLPDGRQIEVPLRPEPGLRERIDGTVQEIAARRDFWIADADLAASLSGTGPGGGVYVLGIPPI
ncbi:MAG: TolC family protein [Geminicoccaceae bacterium]